MIDLEMLAAILKELGYLDEEEVQDKEVELETKSKESDEKMKDK